MIAMLFPHTFPTQVRLQEMRESLRIIYQCINEMPNGLFKAADHKASYPMDCLRLLITRQVVAGNLLPATLMFISSPLQNTLLLKVSGHFGHSFFLLPA
jgi:hypothetical protein